MGLINVLPISPAQQSQDVVWRTAFRTLWAEILNEDPNDIMDGDSFFDLGGDSVSSVELAALAEEEGIDISVEDIFQNPSLQAMAAKATLRENIEEPQDLPIPPFSLLGNDLLGEAALNKLRVHLANVCGLPADCVEDAYPVSPIQEGMMAASMLGNDGYMTQLSYVLGDKIDPERFKWAWELLARSHAVMRTRFVQGTGTRGMLQVVTSTPCEWSRNPGNPDSYLLLDAGTPMQEGDALLRQALLFEPVTRTRILILTLHHAIFDASSLGLILQDAAQIYYGDYDSGGRPSFNKYIQHLQQSDMSAFDNYWAKELKGSNPSPFPALPTIDFQPRASCSYTMDTNFTWPNTTGVTKSLLVRAAWTILMSLRSNNLDVTFALTQSGRSAALRGIKDIAGPTLTAVPIRAKLDMEESIWSFLASMQAQASRMIPFEHYGTLNVRRRLGEDGLRACNFQNLLLVQSSTDSMDQILQNLDIRRVDSAGKKFVYEFALVNETTLSSNGYKLDLGYDPRILSKSSVKLLANQFQEVLSQICFKNSDLPLSDIRCFGLEDYKQLRAWNSLEPKAVYQFADQLFSAQAKESPSSQAICAWDGNFTFEELDTYTTYIANHLITLGVKPGVLVPIALEKSKWAVVSILSVLKAGGAWIPLDPKHPETRLKEIVDMSKSTLILSSPLQAPLISGLCPHLIIPENFISRHIPSAVECPLRHDVRTPEDTAYVLFTSGSTGTPKGVVISHASLCTGIVEQAKPLSCNSSWRCLQFSAHTFDPSISETLMTLCHGGCVCVPSEDQRLNDLAGAINDLQVNCVQLTPSMAHVLVPADIPTVKTMIFVGEASTTEIVRQWAGKLRLMNAYGPTETCIYCCVKADLTPETSPMDVGFACGGNVWIVEADDHERLAAVGCIGEIVVSGHSVGKGYLGNEESTSAAFVTCSWLAEMLPEVASNRLYKTGDLGYYNHDGSICLVGRRDNQIKLRGNRIELGEIESRLQKLLPDATILALVPTSGPCKNQIVVLLSFQHVNIPSKYQTTLSLSTEMESRKMRVLLKGTLAQLSHEVPSYMVPQYHAVIERFPLNPSGKLDRKVIREWTNVLDAVTYGTIAGHTFSGDTPEDLLYDEQLFIEMKAIWNTILRPQKDNIGPASSFFFLGGDSLSAIKVVAQSKAKNMSITVQDIFLNKTLGRLCQSIKWNSARTPEGFLSPSTSRLSTFQEFHIKHIPPKANGQPLCTPITLHLKIETPQSILKQAFDTLVHHHAMLRTRFRNTPEGWRQELVAGKELYRLRFSQYGYLGDEACAKIKEDSYNSIDVFNGPVFSVDVYRTHQRKSVVFIVGHPLLVDSTSWVTILADLELLMVAKDFVPHTNLSFHDWSSVNADLPVLNRLSDLEQVDIGSEYESLNWSLGLETTRYLLTDANHLHRTTVSELLVATTLYSHSRNFAGRSMPIIGVENNDRQDALKGSEYAGVVGQFSTYQQFKPASKNLIKIHDFIKLTKSLRNESANATRSLPELYISVNTVDLEAIRHDLAFTAKYHTEDVSRWPHESPLELFFEVRNGALTFTMSFDRRLDDGERFLKWSELVKEVLENLRYDLAGSNPHLDIFDFPLLQLNPKKSPSSIGTLSTTLQILPSHIEDIYPCSSQQVEMLVAQIKDPSVFLLKHAMEVTLTNGIPIDVQRLAKSWETVVQRHSILRTLFHNMDQNGSFIQVVLRSTIPRWKVVDSWEAAWNGITLDCLEISPPHHLSIFQSSPRSIKIVLNISHALTDGHSLSILKDELLKEYLNDHTVGPPPLYSFFIRETLEPSAVKRDTEYWQNLVSSVTPCIVKTIDPQLRQHHSSMTSLRLPNLSRDSFELFCQKEGLTLATVVDTAWALTLESINGCQKAVFGFINSGRTSAVPRINEIMGPTLNMLINSVEISSSAKTDLGALSLLSQHIQKSRLDSMSHSHCSPSEIARQQSSSQLFNTAVNFQMTDWLEKDDTETRIDFVEVEDPWNVDIMVRVWVDAGTLGARLEYRSSSFELTKINALCDTFGEKLRLFQSTE